jgi:hypothetical protein
MVVRLLLLSAKESVFTTEAAFSRQEYTVHGQQGEWHQVMEENLSRSKEVHMHNFRWENSNSRYAL